MYIKFLVFLNYYLYYYIFVLKKVHGAECYILFFRLLCCFFIVV